MQIALTAIILLAGGCSSTINAELSLVAQSKRGLAAINTSLKDREAIAARDFDARRARLDAAFDADAAAHAGETNPQWFADAAHAYAAAIDALSDAKAASRRAAQTDQENLDAVDAALDELTTLNRAQLDWAPFKESK